MTARALCPLYVSLACVLLGASLARADVPAGWIVAGSNPGDYEFSSDATTARNGGKSALIAAKSTASRDGFGTLMQSISASNYRGARWRLSGYLKTSAAARAQMWMRVDGVDGKPLAFDNMDSRPVTGTSDWKRYEIVLDVPADSFGIAFGFFLIHGGKVWADNFRLEKVDATVPVTATAAVSAMPLAPANPDFEK